MMIKKIAAVVLGAVLAVSATAGFASEATTATKTQFADKMYADLNVGYAKIKEKVAGSEKQDNKGVAVNANVGMNLNDTMAVEAGVSKYPHEKFDNGVKGTSNYSVHVAAKGTMPVADNYAAFAKAGVARVHHKVNAATDITSEVGKHVAYAPFAAVGVEDAISDNTKLIAQVSATAKAKRHGVRLPAMAMASIGFGFDF